MKLARTALAALAAATLHVPAHAQPATPRYEEPPEYTDRSDEEREAYRRGYERGFERGYARGRAEGERRAASVAAPAPPPPRPGPIQVTGAVYGTLSRNCDATRFVARRANGNSSYAMEVTNQICGDPAHGERKSLDVSYLCGEIPKTASANEHRTLTLTCPR